MTQLPSESLRVAALEQAVLMYGAGTETDILTRADQFLTWLRSGGTPRRLRLSISPPVGKTDMTTPPTKGPVTMAQITDTQKFKITADPEDAAGYDVDVPVRFESADTAIATVVDIPDDPKSVYIESGTPGSTVITATVTTLAGADLTATLAVDVVTGDVAMVNLIAGDPEEK